MVKRQRYAWYEQRVERWACWKRYEVRDKNELMGDDLFLFSAGRVTRLKQNNLFALAKSYVESKIVASVPGLDLE
jgi:hypothetical protein